MGEVLPSFDFCSLEQLESHLAGKPVRLPTESEPRRRNPISPYNQPTITDLVSSMDSAYIFHYFPIFSITSVAYEHHLIILGIVWGPCLWPAQLSSEDLFQLRQPRISLGRPAPLPRRCGRRAGGQCQEVRWMRGGMQVLLGMVIHDAPWCSMIGSMVGWSLYHYIIWLSWNYHDNQYFIRSDIPIIIVYHDNQSWLSDYISQTLWLNVMITTILMDLADIKINAAWWSMIHDEILYTIRMAWFRVFNIAKLCNTIQ